MNCLVTGGAGFIGSNLVNKLLQNKNKVSIIDIKKPKNSKAQVHIIDIRNLDLLQQLETPDIIFHLAASTLIPPSFLQPKYTVDINSVGTLNILEFARTKNKIPKIIYAGSNSFYYDVYANPYAYSKWIGEEHCKLYNKLYGVPTAIARFFNVYGPKQNNTTLIGYFKELKKANKPLKITGNGQQRRDFTHVDDIVNGLISLSQTDYFSNNVFDLGTGKDYSVLEIAQAFGGPIEFLPERRGEAITSIANIENSKKLLNYQPKQDLIEYIKNL